MSLWSILGAVAGGAAAAATGGAALPFIAGGAALGSGIDSSNAAADANASNRNIMEEQNLFQEQMSSTAYQRATADMKAAGINPMLAIQNGGASTTSGGSAQMQAVPAIDPAKALATAFQMKDMQKSLDQKDSQISLLDAQKQTELADQTLKLNNARSAALAADTTQAQLPAVKAQAEVDAGTAAIDKKLIKVDAISRRVSNFLGLANSAKNLVTPSTNINIKNKYNENDLLNAAKGKGVLTK